MTGYRLLGHCYLVLGVACVVAAGITGQWVFWLAAAAWVVVWLARDQP